VAVARSTADPIAALAGELVVLDGALATQLERRGADLRDPLWSAKCLLEQPEMIRAVHLEYFRAGAQVATTATYQASFEGFARRGIGHGAAAALMLRAVELAAEAREQYCSLAAPGASRPLIAASIGPYGAMLADGSEYRGHYALSDRELEAFHRARLELLAGSGADLVAFETIPCLREARILADLLARHPGTTAWLSFSCRDGERNCEGESIAQCAAALRDHPQISAVGINCTAPRHVAQLLRRMRDETGKPLIAYPNAGQNYDASSKRWVGAHAPFALQAAQWVRSGARLIGGCCGTSPEDIAALRAVLTSERARG